MFCFVTKWVKNGPTGRVKKSYRITERRVSRRESRVTKFPMVEISSLVLVEFSGSRADLREDGESTTRSGIKTASAFRGKRGSRHLGVIRHRWGVVQM